MRAAPGKRCGACRACCVELRIETPEFRKAGGTPCPHHTGAGCGIYTTRYKICRDFLCGWLLFPELDDDWRPDRSGVLILPVAQASLPPAYRPAGNGVQLLVTGGEAAIARPGFGEYVAGLVSRGVGVYLTATTPHALVNAHLQPMVAAGDMPGTVRTLQHLHRLLMTARDGKGILRILPHLYRLHLEKRRLLAKNRNK
jgi:hypothetical protein